jgi:hypothetical protein
MMIRILRNVGGFQSHYGGRYEQTWTNDNRGPQKESAALVPKMLLAVVR